MLSAYEERIRRQCSVSPNVHERNGIVLFWPPGWVPNWDAGFEVHDDSGMADWLERAWEQMRIWTHNDPNEWHARRNGERHRLVFTCDGKGDFIVDTLPRPYIGLRDGRDPPVGSEDWLGWLCHELSHDFFHGQRVNTGPSSWGEGMCDYSRFQLLQTIGG